MADEDIGRLRSDPYERDHPGPRSVNPMEILGRTPDRDISERIEPTVGADPVGVFEEPVESDEERVIRERREFIAAADDKEIIDGGYSTTAYRRASAVFDEEDDRLQLAEHYNFRSAHFERNGRF